MGLTRKTRQYIYIRASRIPPYPGSSHLLFYRPEDRAATDKPYHPFFSARPGRAKKVRKLLK